MSFQKCPICEGSGTHAYYDEGENRIGICPVCKGARIIDEITGLPPEGFDIYRFNLPNKDKYNVSQFAMPK